MMKRVDKRWRRGWKDTLQFLSVAKAKGANDLDRGADPDPMPPASAIRLENAGKKDTTGLDCLFYQLTAVL
ncbi:MAG TPA: hypothetical protein VNK06_08120, partial [Thermodesulfobacteriota bacterium]|nr:hypothetical protein [Thermodesulfobacteriota bacterium]